MEDFVKGFEEADVIVENDYYVPFVEHAYMETETSIALVEDDGTVKIFVGSQGPTDDRAKLAKVLNLDEEKIQIAHMYMGGGFGGKEDIAGQIHAALAAMGAFKWLCGSARRAKNPCDRHSCGRRNCHFYWISRCVCRSFFTSVETVCRTNFY